MQARIIKIPVFNNFFIRVTSQIVQISEYVNINIIIIFAILKVYVYILQNHHKKQFSI